MKDFLDIFTSDTIVRASEAAANQFFDSVAELAKWGIERRRQLACWRAFKITEIIRRTNELRISEGKRPRRMPLRRRQLIKADAECAANRKFFPELDIVCQAVTAKRIDLEARRFV